MKKLFLALLTAFALTTAPALASTTSNFTAVNGTSFTASSSTISFTITAFGSGCPTSGLDVWLTDITNPSKGGLGFGISPLADVSALPTSLYSATAGDVYEIEGVGTGCTVTGSVTY